MKPVCFLDLDGVLVDFVGGALAMHGKHIPPAEVRWDFPSQVGFDGVNAAAFWAPLGRDFWAGLGWTADGRGILAAVEDAFGPERVCLLTSPCLTPGCAEGKLDWVRRELPGYARRVLVGPCKHLLAGPGKLLVDDHDANCEAFAKAGGASVLVPRPWNEYRDDCRSDGTCDLTGVRMSLRDFVSDFGP